MPIITAITPQKNKERVNIYLDGSFYCGLQKITCASFGLQVGRAVSETELGQIQEQSEQSVAFGKAVGQLAQRMRSQKEIEQYLQKKGFLDQTITQTISKLCDYGYINDAEFAAELVRSYPNLGPRAIQQKLFQKGVSQTIINKLLSNQNSDQEEQKATEIAKKYLKTRINSKNIAQKLNNYIISKGFSFELASKITKELTKGDNNDY